MAGKIDSTCATVNALQYRSCPFVVDDEAGNEHTNEKSSQAKRQLETPGMFAWVLGLFFSPATHGADFSAHLHYRERRLARRRVGVGGGVGMAVLALMGCGEPGEAEDPDPPDTRFVGEWADAPLGSSDTTIELVVEEGFQGDCTRTLYSRGHSYEPGGDTVTFDGITFARVTGTPPGVIGTWSASPGAPRGTLTLVFNPNATVSLTESWPNSNSMLRTGTFTLAVNNAITVAVTESGMFWTDEEMEHVAVHTTGNHEQWGHFWSGNTLAIFGETHFETATGFGGISYATFPQGGTTRGLTFFAGGFVTRFYEHSEGGMLVYRDRQSYRYSSGANGFLVSPRIYAAYSVNDDEDEVTLHFTRPLVERRCTVIGVTLTMGGPTSNFTFTRQDAGSDLSGTWVSGNTTYVFDGNSNEYVISVSGQITERGQYTVGGGNNDWVAFMAQEKWFRQN